MLYAHIGNDRFTWFASPSVEEPVNFSICCAPGSTPQCSPAQISQKDTPGWNRVAPAIFFVGDSVWGRLRYQGYGCSLCGRRAGPVCNRAPSPHVTSSSSYQSQPA